MCILYIGPSAPPGVTIKRKNPMFKKLVLILATASCAAPVFAAPFIDPYGSDPFYDPMAECECQRYGVCPEPPPPPPPKK
jgi:hypothetical protein